MGLFDKIKNAAGQISPDLERDLSKAGDALSGAVTVAASVKGVTQTELTFDSIPNTLEEFTSLKEASLEKPEYAAALFVLAMTHYAKDPDLAVAMVNYLKGPSPLSAYDLSFIRDRMHDNKASYIMNSYFKGATPDNNYTPSLPLTITVSENAYTFQEAGYANVLLRSGGADSLRPVKLREKPSEHKWYLWEQMLLADIRIPKGSDPWA